THRLFEDISHGKVCPTYLVQSIAGCFANLLPSTRSLSYSWFNLLFRTRCAMLSIKEASCPSTANRTFENSRRHQLRLATSKWLFRIRSWKSLARQLSV